MELSKNRKHVKPMTFFTKLSHNTTIATAVGGGILFTSIFGNYGAIVGLIVGGFIGFKSL